MTLAPALEAVRIGPVGEPEHTLGWAAMEWACLYLEQPDGPNAGQPWRFTEEQARFLAHWYAIDEHGQFTHRRGVFRRMKGHGKDPLGAVMCAIEFVGPCRFGGWDAKGEPIAIPQPSSWVQTAAVSKDQTRNTMVLFPSLFSKKAISEYSIDVGKELIYAHHGRCQIQAVTSAPKTLEGARSTFVLANETHLWLENNDGLAMEAAIGRNTAKVSGRWLQITNAHRIGEGSTAERAWEACQKGTPDMLYDSLEVPADTDYDDDESLLAGLKLARGDSYWVPVERLLAEIRDPNTDESMARRYYLNQIRQEKGTWITAGAWGACTEEQDVPADTFIVLGFDGSRFRDCTALVGTVIATGYQWVIASWERPEYAADWEVPAEEVNAAVAEAFEHFDVWRMYCDPYWWEETVAKWAGKYGEDRVAFFHTNSRISLIARAIKAYETSVKTFELKHPADDRFTAHILNVVKKPIGIKDEDGVPMYLITKDNANSPRKIDIAMAAVLSWAARGIAISSGAEPAGEVGAFFVRPGG